MMERLYNTPFENSLRIVVLLDVLQCSASLDRLYAMDFIITYGKTFGISESNLNGDNQYKFSEFASRRELIRLALRELVLNGYAKAVNDKKGIFYQITGDGENYCRSFTNDYATEYRRTAQVLCQTVIDRSDQVIIKAINQMSARSVRKGEFL